MAGTRKRSGNSLGLAGLVCRFMVREHTGQPGQAALPGTVAPFLLKTDDNSDGVDGHVFADIKAAIVTDRYAYFEDFLNTFYNTDQLAPARISDRA
jgi:non-heme chloroperoxidase